MIEIANYIEGALVAAQGGGSIRIIEPATGREAGATPDSDKRDVDLAVAAAQRAFPSWSTATNESRSRALLRIADLIERDAEKLAHAESVDTGKPISLANRVDIPRAAANFRFYATAILHTHSDCYVTNDEAVNYTIRRPRGVAGVISPWNLPLYLLSWKIAPALATGNTVVAKPSEITPITAFLLSKLCIEAGLPPGVLNIVHGEGSKAGASIVEHPGVPTISFTGGTATGSLIATAAAPMFKRVGLELGGKNANIIFADADMDDALQGALRAAFTNQGQICLCGSRIYIERSVYEPFVERLVAGARSMILGDPLEPETNFGSLVSEAQRAKVASYVELARSEGAEILCGGSAPAKVNNRCRDGFFYLPTVITGVAPQCRMQQEEIFGPVVTVTPFDSDEEAIRLANSTPYGLAAMLWTRDIGRAHRVAASLDAGVVWINCWMLRDLRTPFGGMKRSGVGREGGDEALRFFTEPKNICVRL